MKKLVIAFLACAPLLTLAQDAPMEGWQPVAKTKTDRLDYKLNSAKLNKTREGKDTVQGVVRTVTIGSDQIHLALWTVTLEACDNGYGAVAASGLDGSIPIMSQFAFGSGNFASIGAKFICDQRPK